ncbi:UbiX family flavin prenyltransferase [uncultured Helicobacter sp.]|uniref:UbiX family flavin prenyltransferase n=1 Tax=uncultured Helicobacter sp. TaxID=175537 RepID=UPI0026379002|nr:UbiX family flavin prenyltransferase [uncultured Helicobacter sp.]
MKRIIIGISGASGVGLGLKFLKALPNNLEKYCVLSKGAKKVLELEEKVEFDFREIWNLKMLDDEDLGACIASGSFVCESMAVIPCSSDVLAKIACGISDTLLLRAASVMIKENRRLLLGVREMPFSAIMLENMLKLSKLGVVIAPPIFGYYVGSSVAEMEELLMGKWCDSLGISYEYKRWR